MDSKNKNPAGFHKWLQVEAYKHNGDLHRLWSPAYLVEETSEYWAIASSSSLVTEQDGRRWITSEPAVFILFKHKWQNVIAMYKDNGVIVYYVNVASPTILDHGVLRYIDYDLDLKLFQGGEIKELDVEEFGENAKRFEYPETVQKICRASFARIRADMLAKEFPFDWNDVNRLYGKFNVPPLVGKQ